MIFEVVLSKKASDTFHAIRSQIVERWSEKEALKFEERTVKVLQILSNYPLAYQSIESDPSIRKAFIHKNCSLFYKLENVKVVVAFFWDNRQDPVF